MKFRSEKWKKYFKRGEISYYFENDSVILVMKKAVLKQLLKRGL